MPASHHLPDGPIILYSRHGQMDEIYIVHYIRPPVPEDQVEAVLERFRAAGSRITQNRAGGYSPPGSLRIEVSGDAVLQALQELATEVLGIKPLLVEERTETMDGINSDNDTTYHY